MQNRPVNQAVKQIEDWLARHAGYSYIDIPPGSAGGETVSFHLVPVSVSGLWRLSGQNPLYGEKAFG